VDSRPVAQRLEGREIELLGKGLEVDARHTPHRAHELLEPRQLGVELLEHALLSVLDLVLRLAGAQRRGQVVPEAEQARVEHLQHAADVARAVPVQEEQPGRGVVVLRLRAVALALEEAHRQERIEEVLDAARVQLELRSQLRPRHAPRAEAREHAELGGGQEHLGRPEGEGGLEDRSDVGLPGHPGRVRAALEPRKLHLR